MNVLLYHIWNIITGYTSIMEIESPGTSSHPYLESINIRYPSNQNAINFLVKFLPNFQRKRVEISIIYECYLKIVKICQKCANLENGSLSKKLLRIEKSRSKSYKLLKRSRFKFRWNFFFSFGCVLHLASVTSITPIPHPDSLPHPTYARAQAVRHSLSLAWMPGDLAVRPFNYSVPKM